MAEYWSQQQSNADKDEDTGAFVAKFPLLIDVLQSLIKSLQQYVDTDTASAKVLQRDRGVAHKQTDDRLRGQWEPIHSPGIVCQQAGTKLCTHSDRRRVCRPGAPYRTPPASRGRDVEDTAHRAKLYDFLGRSDWAAVVATHKNAMSIYSGSEITCGNGLGPHHEAVGINDGSKTTFGSGHLGLHQDAEATPPQSSRSCQQSPHRLPPAGITTLPERDPLSAQATDQPQRPPQDLLELHLTGPLGDWSALASKPEPVHGTEVPRSDGGPDPYQGWLEHFRETNEEELPEYVLEDMANAMKHHKPPSSWLNSIIAQTNRV